MLIPPKAPRIRSIDQRLWTQVNHRPLDGKLDDCFTHTSLHLSFTKYEIPIVTGEAAGRVDAEVVLLELLISVHDRGEWVGDLDVIGTLQAKIFLQRSPLIAAVHTSDQGM